MQVQYFVNGVKSTFFNRVYNTTTFWSATSIFLTGCVLALETPLGWKAAVGGAVIKAAILVVKDIRTVAQLKAQAQDPNFEHVVAVQKP